MAQNYVDVVNDRGTWDNPDRITIDIVERELFSKYPFDWGKMNRCFRTTKRNVCYELLLETIKNSADTIDSLRESRIEFVRLDSGPFREKTAQERVRRRTPNPNRRRRKLQHGTILFSSKGSGTSCVNRKSYSYRLPSQSAP